MKVLRGFARLPREDVVRLARKGGANVPSEKRSFSQNVELARKAGKKGGENVSPANRSFSKDRDMASRAGKKGARKAREVAAT